MSVIKNIEISNFKAFGTKPVVIEFAPVTLLFGPNSAGKSSVIQALHYAYEVLVRRNFDADRTLIGGESVELGGFLNMVHGHNQQESINILFELDLSETEVPYQYIDYVSKGSSPSMPVEFEADLAMNSELITHALVCFEVAWSSVLERPYVSRYYSLVNHRLFFEVICTASCTNVTLSFTDYGPHIDDPKALIDNRISHPEASYGLLNTDGALPKWNFLNAKHLLENPEANLLQDEGEQQRRIELLTQFLVGPGQLLAEELEKVLYLGPLRDVPERNMRTPLSPSPGRWASGLAAWDTLNSSSESFIDDLNGWLNSDIRFNTGYEIRNNSFRELDIEHPVSIRFDSSPLQAVGIVMEDEEHEVDLEELENLRRWFKELPILRRLEIVNTRSGLWLQAQDLGVGISQMLPIIVAALVREDGLVMIEQPELHIHPALQVAMGDLFIERSGVSNCNFLIETHSEHLLLRLLRRIRETTESELPPGISGFDKDQLAIHFIEGDGLGTASVHRLTVTDDGDLRDDWPRGFFAEREEELF
jgi:hypothetical protein